MRGIPKVSVPEGRKGPWEVSRFVVPEEPSIETLRLAMAGRPIRPGTYTKLTHDKRGVVMSDTPAEKADHLPFVWEAKGHVLINGLGLGMCVGAALAKEGVTKITVVEADQDVIDLVGPTYTADAKVEIIQSCAFDYRPPKGIRYGAVWHDIWDNICADNLDGMKYLHRKYGRKADWQGSWCREICEDYK